MASSTAAGNLLSAYSKNLTKPIIDTQLNLNSAHIDIETITNLMSYHNMKFIKEDPIFVMRTMAGNDLNEIRFDKFNAFIYSPLWD